MRDRESIDAVCPLCSKPMGAGRLRLYEGGEFYHVHCRGRQLQLTALEQIDRAQGAAARAAELIDQTILAPGPRAVRRTREARLSDL